MMQNICLVTMQSFKRGKSGHQIMETFPFISGFVLFNLYVLKVFSSICDNNKEVYFPRKEWSRV